MVTKQKSNINSFRFGANSVYVVATPVTLKKCLRKLPSAAFSLDYGLESSFLSFTERGVVNLKYKPSAYLCA